VNEDLDVVVLAAGDGTRLRPLTLNLPKTLAPICNVPILTHLLRLIDAAGLSRATVVLPPMQDEVRTFLERQVPPRLRLRIETPISPFQGTLPRVRDVLGGDGAAVLVIYGDSLLSADLNQLIEAHRSFAAKGALVTILAHRPDDLYVAEKEGRTYHGVMQVASGGRITTFVEKPLVSDIPADGVANAAVFVCERSLFDDGRLRGASDFSKHVFQRLVAEEPSPLYACDIGPGFRIDVGSVERFVDVNLKVLRRRLAVPTLGAEERRGAWLAEGCKIVPPVLLGAGVRVEADAQVGPDAILGDGCVVGAGAVVRSSIVMNHCSIGAGLVVEHCVVGTHASLKSNAPLPAYSVVGPYSVIGAMPWPE
jgi:mannose-1-phosphate guanylyltransferase/phosphomannomutase